MRILLAILALWAAAPARAAGPRPCSPRDSTGLLLPSDPAFADAEQFRAFLTRNGFVVHCVIRSMFQSFIWTWPEASFLTNRADITVRFAPPPDGAERVRVNEARIPGGWRYTFPGHNRASDTLYSDKRQNFLLHRRWLVLVTDSATARALREAFSK